MAATHFSKEEATQKLAELTRDDWLKSHIFAKFILKHSKADLRFEELVDEAVARTLEGRRRWKIGLDGPTHLFGAMKSILSSWNKSEGKRRKVLVNISSVMPEGDFGLGEADEEMIEILSSAAEHLIANGNLSDVEAELLSGLMAGEDAFTVTQRVGMAAEEYRQMILSLMDKIESYE